MTPSRLSRELRTADTPDLNRRRAIVGLSLVGVAAGVIVTAYQTGLIDHLPDPPGAVWDSDKVDASDYAYRRFQTPDALAMIVTYGVTAWLAGAGGKDRAETLPWLPVALAAKLVADVATTVQLGREEWAENKKLCAYCQAATVASVVSLPLALPEALRGLRRLFGR